MPRERGEVDVEFVEIHRHVRHRLAGVENHHGTYGTGTTYQLCDGSHGPGHVGLVGKSHDLDRVIELKRIEINAAVLGHGVPLQRRAGALAQLLPRHQVRVVLQFGDHDGIALTDVKLAGALIAEHVSNFIQRLSGVLGEGDLIAVGTNEGGDGLASGLVRVIGLLRQLVGTAVHRSVGAEHELLLGLPYRQGTLRGRSRIQVHQRFTVAHRAREDRELFPNRINV